MAKQSLHLLNRHTFVNSHRRQCSFEFMRMYLVYAELLSK